MTKLKCLICESNMLYYFSKRYGTEPFKDMMKNIGEVEYFTCTNCGLTISKTHSELESVKWKKLNYDFHHYLENNNTDINQPPYLEQALLLKVLSTNGIIDSHNMLDYAGGYGSLSKTLKKYFNMDLPVYDPYVQNDGEIDYIDNNNLSTFKTVLNSALFEHLLTRQSFDEINALVSENNGAMLVHTRICETVPKDPDWFYLQPPVHTTFHTNKSMELLMKQWGYVESIYCLPARSWVLLKENDLNIEKRVNLINSELQTEYLVYKSGFVDYWKGS